ncbi:hypothetical protein ACE6H2_011207 [Prunus campanulata]
MEGYNLGVRKGAWTGEEDDLLRQCIENHGEGNWHQVPYKAVENCSTPSQTSPSTKNGNDWWETFLDDEDAFERATCYGLALEAEVGFTSFWVDDMPQSKRQCTNVSEGLGRGDFSFNVDLWNHSKQE